MHYFVSLSNKHPIDIVSDYVFPAQVEPETSNAMIYGFEVLVAIGSGSFIQAGYATIQSVSEPADTSDAIAFMMLGQYDSVKYHCWIL